MGLTSSLFAGLSGMKTNEFRMDVIGNNIANVNTYAFKASRANFQSQFSNTFSFGSAPAGPIGGTNPVQVGTGVGVGAVQRNFAGGAPETTGNKTDLAVQGQGLFILERPDASYAYTRDGSFQFNAENYLLSADGAFLQGYSVDPNFNIIEGSLSKIRIPLGEISTAIATSEASFSGNLDSDGVDAVTAAANGSPPRGILNSAELGDGTIGTAISGTTLMTNLVTASGNVVEDGNVITLKEAIKGGKTLPAETFTITATSNLGEFLTWFEDVLGIVNPLEDTNLQDLTADLVPNPGVTVNATNDGITVVSNIGNHNTFDFGGNQALEVTQGTAAGAVTQGLPFSFTAQADSDDVQVPSVRTSFRAFDSLGVPLNVDITMAMESKNPAGGITWRYFAECNEDSDTDRVVGTGTVSFDAYGNYLESTSSGITINRTGTGAATPQAITLDFGTMDGYAMPSAMSLLSQDGIKAGTLQDFSVAADGVITGSFTNGLSRPLGQVVLATFRNYEGLVADVNNVYTTGPNSGDPIVRKPQELGAGAIAAAALELSNVDLSREFINLIISSTGFSASSRVIQTSDRLLTELMMLTR